MSQDLTNSVEPHPRLTPSEWHTLNELLRCDAANRRRGKTQFRHKLATLAKKIGYGRTTTSQAINSLCDKVGMEKRRTGRSCFFSFPDPERARAALRPPAEQAKPEVQFPNTRSSETEPRNKGRLKKQLGSGAVTPAKPTNSDQRPESPPGINPTALHICMSTAASIRFDGEEYRKRFGLQKLSEQLARYDGCQGISLDHTEDGTLVVVYEHRGQETQHQRQ